MNLSIIEKNIIPTLYISIEKQSIYQVLCAVRNIGKHDMESKEDVINEVMNIMGFTEQERIASRKLTQQQMTQALQKMSDEKKIYFAKFISNVALVGGVTTNESKFVFQLFNLFQIPQI